MWITWLMLTKGVQFLNISTKYYIENLKTLQPYPGIITLFRSDAWDGSHSEQKHLTLPHIDYIFLKVPDSSFQILVDYISGTQGYARQMIVEKTMKVIKAVELWSELSEEGLKEEDIAAQVPDGKIPDVMYERARTILQSMNDV